jgi:hypothetical protein
MNENSAGYVMYPALFSLSKKLCKVTDPMIKVSVKPFQRLARVQRRAASGRPPQRAKSPDFRSSARVNLKKHPVDGF